MQTSGRQCRGWDLNLFSCSRCGLGHVYFQHNACTIWHNTKRRLFSKLISREIETYHAIQFHYIELAQVPGPVLIVASCNPLYSGIWLGRGLSCTMQSV
ncbi:hypothetical protein AB205_0035820 [Aquarana catesbeiana]|uniref:Uncharacterized protein n=1 Tax=Aquarana catesbeiana TaxID=8400 RepID=A0A2G9RIN8_AQUCT|nr:hypothetical protein AB205_0035820 [Aquarana catesbeiana]